MENSPIAATEDAETSSDDTLKKSKKESRLGLMAVKKETPKDKKPEVLADKELPLEKPSQNEAIEVIRPNLVEIIEEIEAGRESDPTTDPPVEEFRDLIKTGEHPDVAFSEVMSDMGVEQDEIQALIEEAGEVGIQSDSESAIEDFEDDNYVNLNNETMSNDDEGNGSAGATSTPSPAPPGGPGGSGGMGPIPPGQSPFGAPTGGAGWGRPLQGPGLWQANAAPSPAMPDIQAKHPEYYGQASPAAMALFGGIIGYLIGRRRGRIKTEKKLLPVQRKLEKEVKDMQFDLQEKEKKIRKVAAEKVKKEGMSVIEVFNKDKQPNLRPEPQAQLRRRAPEANILHSSEHKPEHIGHMLVSSETNTGHGGKQPEKTKENLPRKIVEQQGEAGDQAITERQVETLKRTELLELSTKIVVNGSTLRQIYETHLIGERGLRRLVAEHLRGGDLKQALQTEIVEREIDFERDPAMRDMAPNQTIVAQPSAGSATLNQLVDRATASLGDNSEEAAFYRARAAYESQQNNQQQKHRQVIDIAFISVILILLFLVVYLVISRE